MKFIKKLRVSDKIIAVISLVVLIAALIPIYRLALYSAPFSDDFSYSYRTATSYRQYGMSGVLPAMAEEVKSTWYTWQGTYSSIALMSLCPFIFGEEYYFLGVWVIITTLAASGFVLAYVAYRKVLRADRAVSVIFGALFSLMLVEFCLSGYDGFFWYNSAVHYTFMHGMMFFLLAVDIELIYARKRGAKIGFMLLEVLLSFIVAGSNFVTSLQGFLLILCIFIVWVAVKKKDALWNLPGITAYAIGLLINLLAPGNDVREIYFEGYGALQAILKSLEDAFFQIPFLTGFRMLVLIAVMIPVIVKAVSTVRFSFKMPWAITIIAFGIYASGFVSSYYGMGSGPVLRTATAIKYTYQMLFILCAVYWTGWVVKRISKRRESEVKINHNLIYYFACCLLMATVALTSKNSLIEYMSYGSYFLTHYNMAQTYKAENDLRTERIKNSPEDTVFVEPLSIYPGLLTGGKELTEDPTHNWNTFMARYYGKSNIILSSGENDG